MKHFKLMKGVLACLLSLALVVTCFGNIGAKATETAAETKTKVTFTYTVGEVKYIYEKEIPYTSDTDETTSEVTYVPGEGATVTLGDFYNNAKATIGNGENATTKNLKDDYIISALAANNSTFESAGDDSALADATWTLTGEMISALDDKSKKSVDVNTVFVPKTIDYIFAVAYKDVTYTAKIPVENKKTGKVSIKASDIISAAEYESGNTKKALADENVVFTKIAGTPIDSADYTYESAELSAYADGDVPVGTVENNVVAAAISEIAYDPAADAVVVTSPVKDLTISYAGVKAATGNKVKKFSTLKTAKAEGEEDASAIISLTDSKKGVKVAENKTTYLFIAAGAVKADKTATYDANVTVDATPYKKIAVSYNYAKAEADVKEDIAISSITLTPTSGEAKTYTVGGEGFEENLSKLQYSLDNGKTWLNVNGEHNPEIIIGYSVKGNLPSAVEAVVITDYSKLVAGQYAYTSDGKWVKAGTPVYNATSNNNALKVTVGSGYNEITEKTYYYLPEVDDVAETTEIDEHKDAGWYTDNDYTAAMPNTISVDGDPGENNTITITYTSGDVELSAGATVTLKKDENGANLTPATTDIIELEADKDNGAITGKKLYSWTQMKKAPKIQFRIAGARATTGTDARNAYRNTKAAKVAVKAAGKAVKVKVNGVNGTIAIKNGYDYAVLTAEGTPTTSQWTTVLPFNKEGKATSNTIATAEYVPAKKCTETTAAMFTSKKVSSIDLAPLFEENSSANTLYIYVRKSASDGKPASAVTLVKVDKATAAPSLTALKTDATKYAEAAKSEKGTALTIPAIKNADGDKNTASYEYLIIKAEDLGKVDYAASKWSKLVAGKALTVDKTKSKYVVGTENKEATLGTDCIILIRRAGDKKKGVLPSEVLQTKVVAGKMTVDKVEVDSFAWVANS